MRLRLLWAGLGLSATLLLGGCAALNEWLEGTVGEEEAKEGVTPEEELANQQKALAGDDAAARKGAVPKLVALKREDALEIVIGLLDDHDPAVCVAALSGLQTVTGFPEKTEDERQLDPEGYEQQLLFKRMVLDQGADKLAAALRTDSDEIRYGALIIFYNLAKPPVEPEDAKAQLQQRVGRSILDLARDDASPLDARLLAIDTLVSYDAGDELASLQSLLQADDPALRGRVALALGQAAEVLGEARQSAADSVAALVADRRQPTAVRWRAAAALGRLGGSSTTGLEVPFVPQPKPDDEQAMDDPQNQTNAAMEAYRTYALSSSSDPAAAERVTDLNRDLDAVATAAEEKLDAERKMGYR